MNDIFRVSLVQFDPKWEDVEYNLSRLGSLMQPLVGKTDLIVLPEMFTTGFSMNTNKICSTNNYNETTQWMKQQAQATGAMIVGGMAVNDLSPNPSPQDRGEERYYNRLHWINPDGDGGQYDKHFLFSMSDEPKHYTPGIEQKRFEWL